MTYMKCELCTNLVDYEVVYRPYQVFGITVRRPESTVRLCEEHFIIWSRETIIEYNKNMKVN